MARPRKISDEDVLEALAGQLATQGPQALTFASASSVTGLSPATLVQRYGSREAMLRAGLLWMWDELDKQTAFLDATQSVDAEGAIGLLIRLSADYGGSDEAAQGLLLLREDLRDPVLRARGVAWNHTLSSALGRRLSADANGQERLGRLMASQWQGAVLWWGFSREGTLRSYLRRELREWLSAVGVR